MDPWLTWLSSLSLVAWAYLVFLHGRFWRCSERLDASAIRAPARWPAIAAVVPARDEEETVEAALESLLAQDYPGSLSVTLIDDRSGDRTAEIAAAVGRRHADRPRLTVLTGAPRPPGWSGKLWALQQGIDAAIRAEPQTELVFLSDADIAHAPQTLRALAAKAEVDRRDLVSLMARLNCETGWERLLIPAFIFFFQKLYPFPLANDDARRTAAAAGGCMLVRRRALERIGGLAAIRGALIDDCAMARAIKRSGGGLWLGLAEGTRSLRVYRSLSPIWAMVARSAFTQLRYSAVALLGTVIGMTLVYLVPPLVLLAFPLHGNGAAATFGTVAWALMAAAYLPTIRYHRLPEILALSLPIAAFFYLAMTLDSARRHWWGRGSRWKGREYGRSEHLAKG